MTEEIKTNLKRRIKSWLSTDVRYAAKYLRYRKARPPFVLAADRKEISWR